MAKSRFFEDLKIDRYDLDNELVRQPQLYAEWALKEVQAGKDLAIAKNDYEIVKAETEAKIRKDPDLYGLSNNPIQAAINSVALRQKKVKRYFKRFINAEADLKKLKRAERAFGQRKNMLEALVSLNVQMHFADPKVPRTEKDAMATRTSGELKSGLKKSMGKRKIKRRR